MSIIVVGTPKEWDKWRKEKVFGIGYWKYNVNMRKLVIDSFNEEYCFFSIYQNLDNLMGHSYANAYFLEGSYTSELINAVLLRCRKR